MLCLFSVPKHNNCYSGFRNSIAFNTFNTCTLWQNMFLIFKKRTKTKKKTSDWKTQQQSPDWCGAGFIVDKRITNWRNCDFYHTTLSAHVKHDQFRKQRTVEQFYGNHGWATCTQHSFERMKLILYRAI